MKKLLILFAAVLSFYINASAQAPVVSKKRILNENTIVKDSSGMQYPYAVWKKMVSSGDYRIKAIDKHSDSTAYVLIKMTEEQKDERMSRMRKPAESAFFTTGEKIESFNARDINGNKIKLKDLEGKVVVLNFWFIGCPPCRKEIPELNNIALKYANDPNVVFIAICLDQKYEVGEYVENNPFAYHIIYNGQMYADLYKIHLYPTNVILDKQGKVKFHASGLSANTPYWIVKTIEEAKNENL